MLTRREFRYKRFALLLRILGAACRSFPFAPLLSGRLAGRFRDGPRFAFFYILKNPGLLDAEYARRLAANVRVSRWKFFDYVVGDFLLRNRVYAPVTLALLKKAQYRADVSAVMRYADCVIQTRGYKSREIRAFLAKKILRDDGFFACLTKTNVVALYVMAEQNGDARMRKRTLARIARYRAGLGDYSLYFARRIALAGLRNAAGSYLIAYKSDMYVRMLRERERLENLFRLYRGRVCVVGNAPVERGRNRGALIDSFPVVVRINNYSLDLPADYGRKTDVWCRVANAEVDNANLRNQKTVVFASNNFMVKRRDAYRYCLPCRLAGAACACIPSGVFRELIAKLNCLPSTGLALLYWIYKVSGPVPRSSVFGFSHDREDLGDRDFRKHYYADRVAIGNHIHDFQDEKAVFNEIIGRPEDAPPAGAPAGGRTD